MRTTLSVVAGYVAMAVTVFISFTLYYAVLGPETVFLPRLFDVSLMWIGGTMVITVLAGLLGGWLTISLSRSGDTVVMLAVVILVLGVLAAVLARPDPSVPLHRLGPIGAFDAMMYARLPAWLDFVNPVLGAIGAIFGGRS